MPRQRLWPGLSSDEEEERDFELVAIALLFMYISAFIIKQPFISLFSKTLGVKQQQKSRIILNFNEALDDWMAVASVRQYANHLHVASDR